MSWYSRRGRGWGGFAPYVSQAERQADADRAIARLEKKGMKLSPIRLAKRTIAKTFWGKAWCDNIESYRDYAYRLERGRQYVRSGAVIDLQIAPGRVNALVVGSGRSPYEIEITIKPMVKAKFDELVKRASGKISSLMALAQGKLPPELLEDFCNAETGLFPKPSEIGFACSCPDGASCCKHVAAVLYGIGARLDDEPTLFFTLRGIDPNAIVTADVVDTLTADTQNELASSDLSDVFGIDLAEPGDAAAASAKPSEPPHPSDSIGALCKAVRQRHHLSQAKLARLFGTYQAVVSQVERGKSNAGKSWREKLEKLLSTPSGELQ